MRQLDQFDSDSGRSASCAAVMERLSAQDGWKQSAEPSALYTYRLSENTSVTLDLIRALSAQMVAVGHGISFLRIATWLHEPNFPWLQNIGVLIFFLLSGFLITHSTFSKKARSDYNFKIFFIERFSRIYSGYLPAMILVVLLDVLFISLFGKSNYPYDFGLKAFLGNLFMLEDYPLFQKQIAVTSLGTARPFWTLAVEWWIYMFFGCLVLKKSFSNRHLLYAVCLAISAVVPFFNSIVAGRGNGLFVVWMMGLVVAFLLNGRVTVCSPHRCAMISLVLLVAGFWHAYSVKTAYDLIFAASLMGSLFFAVRALDSIGPVFNPGIGKIIKIAADYSFSLYLIHYSVFFYLVPLMVQVSPWILFALGFVGSNLIALLLALFTEMRHKQLTKFLIKTCGGN